MATNLDERIAKSKAQTAKREQLLRTEKRKEREAEKKKNQRRNYIVGELVTKHFPEIMALEPGTKAENTVRFEPLNAFLSILSANQKLLDIIKEKAACYISAYSSKEGPLASNPLQCVSGHQPNSESACVRKGGDECG